MRAPAILLAVSMGAALAAGCARVVETTAIEGDAFGYAPTCSSSLGAYYLPRALLRIKATAGATDISSGGLEASTKTVAERDQPFCLDYLSLPNFKDIVAVERNTSGLLLSISSNVEDRTPQIVQSLAAVAENIAIAGGRATPGAPATRSVDLEFDPFIWNDLMLANTALKRFGFCVYVEGHTFPVYGRDAGAMLAAGRSWCSLDHPPLYRHSLEFSSLPVSPEAMRRGVLYRPNMAHKIVILRKQDPHGRGAWHLYQTRRVEMPNVSPILSIGVERALFATRKTTLKFNNGVLTDVAIDKESELAGFVSIPLAVSKAIVSIPGQIVTFRITDTNNQTALLNAQSELIASLKNYQDTVAARSIAARSAGTTGLGRQGQFVGACVDAGGSPDTCTSIARNTLQ